MTDIKRLLSYTGIDRRYGVKLSSFTTAKTGGACDVLYYPKTLEELEDKVETLKLRQQTMTRQEERVMKKLEEMQATNQQAMGGLQG